MAEPKSQPQAQATKPAPVENPIDPRPVKMTARAIMSDYAAHNSVVKEIKLKELARKYPAVSDLLKSRPKKP